MSINIEIEYIKRIERENEELKNDLLRAEAMEDYWKINSSELEEKVDNLRQDLQNRCNRCIELKKENKKLENENFKYFLEEDETNDYIDKLKLELFDLYRNKQ